MATDLFCYTVHECPETQSLVNILKAKSLELFSKKFLVSASTEVTETGQRIALAYQFRAKSRFLIRVNDKSASSQVPEVLIQVRRVFGDASILVLKENDLLIYGP